MDTIFSDKDVYLIGQSETQSRRNTLLHHATWSEYKLGILRRLPTPHDEELCKLECIRYRILVKPTSTDSCNIQVPENQVFSSQFTGKVEIENEFKMMQKPFPSNNFRDFFRGHPNTT